MGLIVIGPTTVDTSTDPGSRLRRTIDTFQNGNRLLAAPDGSGNVEFHFSTDEGVNWTTDTNPISNLAYPEVFIDLDDFVHVVGMDSNAVEYWRGTPNASRTAIDSWDGPYIPQNASTQGFPSLVVHREGTGWAAHIVWARYWTTTTTSGYTEYRCVCTSSGVGATDGCSIGGHTHTYYTSWNTSSGGCGGCGVGYKCPTVGWHYHEGCNHVHDCGSNSEESRFVQTGSSSDTDNRVYYARYSISSDGVVALEQSATSISTDYGVSDFTKPVIDFRHTGDAKTISGSTPDLYVAWVTGTTGGGDGLRFKRASYSSGTWSWGTERELDTAWDPNGLSMAFDGTRIVMAADISSSPYIDVNERDSSDTSTTPRTPPALSARPDGVSVTYTTEGDIVLLAEDGDTPSICVYDRSEAAWGSWTSIEAVTAQGSPSSLHAKRGRSEQALEVIYFEGTSPYNIRYYAEIVNNPPTPPSWNTEAEARDVNSALLLDWNFEDPDLPNDDQGAYTLRRRIGSGSFEYYVAGSTSWVSSEDATTKNSTVLTNTSLPSGWGTDGDAIHYFSIKTWDLEDEGPSSWSDELAIVPSAKDNPTITDLATIPAATYPISWTVASQTAYQVKVYEDDAGSTGALLYDSGKVNSSSQSHNAPFPTDKVTRWTEVTTWNDEGLKSDPSQDQVDVLYEGPAAPRLTVTPFDDDTAGDPGEEPVDAGLQINVFVPNSNLLDEATATMPFNTGTWAAYLNSTISHDAAGERLRVEADSTSDAQVRSGPYGVSEGLDYTVRLDATPETVARDATIVIDWYDNSSSFLSTHTGAPTPTDGGAEVTATGTAPANATEARIRVSFATPTAGEAWFVDDVALFEDDGTTYFREGFSGVLVDTVDLFRRKVGTTDDIRVATGLGQDSFFQDFAVASGVGYEYRGRSFTNANGSSTDGEWTP